MGAHPHDSPEGSAGSRLGADLAAHVESIVRAAEREARVAEQAIAEQRRSAEEEARRYLAAARLQVDAESAAHAARVATLSTAARRLADELTDAVSALKRELHRDDADAALPRTPWPPVADASERAAEPAIAAKPLPTAPEPEPEPTWTRTPHPEPEPVSAAATATSVAAEPAATTPRAAAPADSEAAPVPSAARLVAIEMAVGGSSRAEVEEHLRAQLAVTDPHPLLDDVFGAASHAGSRLAWGEP